MTDEREFFWVGPTVELFLGWRQNKAFVVKLRWRCLCLQMFLSGVPGRIRGKHWSCCRVGAWNLARNNTGGAPQAHDPSQKDKVRSIYSIYAPRVSLFRSSIMSEFIGSNKNWKSGIRTSGKTHTRVLIYFKPDGWSMTLLGYYTTDYISPRLTIRSYAVQ